MRQRADHRIGVLAPQGNVVHAREFDRLRPEGVAFRFVGFSYPKDATDFCADLSVAMAPALEALKAWRAEVVLVGCTTASMACADDAFTERLRAMAGVPVVTAASASREAIAALGLRSVSVATPYGAVNNRIIEAFLAASGVEVAALEGLDLDRSVETWVAAAPTLTADKVLALSLSVDRPTAEGLYLPCTGMESIDAIDGFERATGKPAFSSVQAGYWAALRRAGIDGRQAGAGRLLSAWDLPAGG